MPAVDIGQLLTQFTTYSDVNRVKADVMSVSQQVRTLFPKKGTLTLNDGRQCMLLTLDGTLAIFYRGNQYNIPVEVYLMEEYPRKPPMMYVRPTTGMALKSGHKHVDPSGLVYLPYLHEWRPERSNLVELCAHASSVFGAEPPVYAKAAAQPAPSRPNPPSAVISPVARQPPVIQKDPKVEVTEAVTAKIQDKLQALYTKLREDIDDEFDIQHALHSGADQIDGMMDELKKDKEQLTRLIAEVQKQTAALNVYLEQKAMEADKEVDVELQVEPVDALSAQMIELVAESHAIEDTLYCLDQALAEGNLKADDFLREVRKLCRRQFMTHALTLKIASMQNDREAQQRAAAQAQGYYYDYK